MKQMIAALLLMTTLAQTAFAQTADRDQQLTAALTALQSEVQVPQEGAQVVALGVGTALLSLAWIGATTTLLRLRALPLHNWNMHPGELMNFTVDKVKYGVAAGGALAWGGALYAGVKWARARGVPVDYHTAEGLRRFFQLPIDEQVALAREDQAFGDFILTLEHDLSQLQTGFDARRAR